MRKLEEKIQLDLCQWMRETYPDIMFRSDGGGLRLPIGLAMKFKRMQSGKAWPDFFIPLKRKGYSGLFIEIKTSESEVYKKDGSIRKNAHVKDQFSVLKYLNSEGFNATFGFGLDGCKEIVERYIDNR